MQEKMIPRFSRFDWFRVGILAVIFGAMVWGFQMLLFRHAPMVFNDPKEDMSFAWYVPLFSLYVIWTERRRILASCGAPSVWGFLAVLPCLCLGFLGTRGIQVRFEILAFVGLLVSVPWALFGAQAARALLFPACFLLFCIPLATFLDVITVHLRLLATSVAATTLQGFGAHVIRQGSMILAADGSFSIDVAEPCSGLRSIFALMALTAAYAYFTQPTWLRRGILFVSSVPLAVLGNVVRILTICLVAQFASKDFAVGFYHDYSGYVVFLVAILLMVAVGNVLTHVCAWGLVQPKDDAPPSAVAAPPSAGSSQRWIPVALALVLLPAMIYQAMTPAVVLAQAPVLSLGEIPGYASVEIGISEAEENILPADTKILKRRYEAIDGSWFQVSLVVGGASKSSIHRPELCLPAQGFLMTHPRTVRTCGRDWRFLTLELRDGGTLGFAYTFFNQDGFRTASHTSRIFRDVWDRSVFNRIDRWVMVTINASSSDDASLSAIAEKVKGFFE